MKKLLLICNYFYPEVASTGQLLTETCEELQKEFDITVICSIPCYTGKIDSKYQVKKVYKEKYQNVDIYRVWVPEFDKKNKISRIKNIVTYYLNSRKLIRKLGKFDLTMTISQPPILGGLLGRYSSRKNKSKLVYLIEDFNPEQTMAVKYSKNMLLLNMLKKVDIKTCKKSDLVITVGEDMQKTLEGRFDGKNVPNNTVINNWIDEKEIYPLDKNNKKVKEFLKEYDLENKFIIMYSGNLGLYYDLENIMDIILKFKDNDDVRFVFVGEGSVKQKLVDKVNNYKNTNIVFIPYQKKEDLVYSLNACDVHLVTNAKGIKGVSVPSKIYGVLATNKPVIGILEDGSEASNIIKKAKCGVVIEPEDYVNIEKTFKDIINKKDNFVNKYSNGRKYLEDNLKKKISLDKYSKELKKIVK